MSRAWSVGWNSLTLTLSTCIQAGGSQPHEVLVLRTASALLQTSTSAGERWWHSSACVTPWSSRDWVRQQLIRHCGEDSGPCPGLHQDPCKMILRQILTGTASPHISRHLPCRKRNTENRVCLTAYCLSPCLPPGAHQQVACLAYGPQLK